MSYLKKPLIVICALCLILMGVLLVANIDKNNVNDDVSFAETNAVFPTDWKSTYQSISGGYSANNITSIKFLTYKPYGYTNWSGVDKFIDSGSNKIAIYHSSSSVYDIAFVCSDTIYAPTDCSHLFSGSYNNPSCLTSIDFENFDTSNAIDMRSMFYWDTSLTELDLSGFDTSNATIMCSMFNTCTGLQHITFGSNFTTANVTDMSYMFYGNRVLEDLDMSNFDMSIVTTVDCMLGCVHAGRIIAPYNMPSNINLSYSDYQCGSTTGVGVIDASKPNEAYRLKYNVTWKDSNGTTLDTAEYLYGDTPVYSGQTLGKSDYEFVGWTPSMTTVTGNTTYTATYNFTGITFPEASTWKANYKTISGIDAINITSIKFLTSKPSDYTNWNGVEETIDRDSAGQIKIYHKEGSLTDIAFVCSDTIYAPANSRDLFAWNDYYYYVYRYASNLTCIEFDNFDTSNAVDMRSMFYWDTALTELDLSGFNTSNVTNMSSMFNTCTGLQHIIFGSDFTTAKVTDMAFMFYGNLSLKDLDLSNFDMSSITTVDNMLGNVKANKIVAPYNLTKDISLSRSDYVCSRDSSVNDRIYASKCSVKNADNSITKVTYEQAAVFPTYSVWQSRYENYSGKVYYRITSVRFEYTAPSGYVNDWNGVARFIDDSNKIAMYHKEGSLTDIAFVCENTIYAPSDCTNLFELYTCNTSITESPWGGYGISDCTSITFNNFNTSGVTNMNGMFQGNFRIKELDLTCFDTSNVTKMGCLFACCYALEKVDLTSFDTSKVTSMYQMFRYCENLLTLDLRNIDMSHVVDITNSQILSNAYPAKIYAPYKMSSGSIYFGYNTYSYTSTTYLCNKDECSYSYMSSSYCSTESQTVVYTLNNCSVSWYSADNTYLGSSIYAYGETPSYSFATPTKANDGYYSYRFIGWSPAISSVDRHYTKYYAQFEQFVVEFPSVSEWKERYTNLSGLDVSQLTSIQFVYSAPSGYVSDWSGKSGVQFIDDNNYIAVYHGNGSYTDIAFVCQYQICAPVDCSYMFNTTSSDSSLLESITFTNFSTAQTTNMSYMFYNCTSILTLDMYYFNTSKVKDMSYMFSQCYNLVGARNGNQFDTSQVTNMEGMFNLCKLTTRIDLSQFDTSKVTNMSKMFKDCENLVNVDVSKFNTCNVANMDEMFYGCSSLNYLYVANFDLKNVKSMTNMLKGITTSNVDTPAGTINAGDSIGICFVIDWKDKLKELVDVDYSSLTSIRFDTSVPSGYTKKWEGKTIYIDTLNKIKICAKNTSNTDLAFVYDGIICSPINCDSLFSGCSQLTNIKFNNFDTTYCKGFYAMFKDCSSLTKLDVSGFNTSLVDGFGLMFYGCSSLQQLNLRNFDTSNAKDMAYMFAKCSSLTSVDVSNWDTTNVVSFASMFVSCSALESINGISAFDTPNAVNMGAMFANCSSLKKLNVKYFETENVTNFAWMFGGCTSLVSLDVSGLDTSNAENMNCMFKDCSSLSSLDVSSFNTSKVTDMEGMFMNCSSLRQLDLSNFKTSAVTDMNNMFNSCNNLLRLDLVSFNTIKVKNMSCMFANCCNMLSLTIDTVKFTTPNVTDMSYMFYNCNNLYSLNVSRFNTAKVTNMAFMFFNCEKVDELEVGGFNTTKVEDMQSMFDSCRKISILNLGNFNMGKVSNYENMLKNIKFKKLVLPQNFKGEITLDGSYYSTKDASYGKNVINSSNASTSTTKNMLLKECKAYWLDESGKVIDSCKIAYSLDPTSEPTAPEKEENEQYSYVFAGWEKIEKESGNVYYKPIYEAIVAKYTVTCALEDGTVIYRAEVEYGTTPDFSNIDTPIKASDDKYTYKFAGWDKEVSAVTGTTYYKAVFSATRKPLTFKDLWWVLVLVVGIIFIALIAIIIVYAVKHKKVHKEANDELAGYTNAIPMDLSVENYMNWAKVQVQSTVGKRINDSAVLLNTSQPDDASATSNIMQDVQTNATVDVQHSEDFDECIEKAKAKRDNDK